MLHLLDANVLITAHRQYYPLDRVPEFWEWVLHCASSGDLKLPNEIPEEICEGADEVADWCSAGENKAILALDELVNVGLVQQVTNQGYAPDMTDEEIEVVGRDPFLIAYALASPRDRCVITTEVSKPRRIRQNRHIPDVCNDLNVHWMDTFGLVRSLNFRTSWRRTP